MAFQEDQVQGVQEEVQLREQDFGNFVSGVAWGVQLWGWGGSCASSGRSFGSGRCCSRHRLGLPPPRPPVCLFLQRHICCLLVLASCACAWSATLLSPTAVVPPISCCRCWQYMRSGY